MRNRSNTKRQRDKKVIESSKYKVQKESVFVGLVLQRTIEQNKSTKTQLRSFPASVTVGFADNSKLIMIEYNFNDVIDKDRDYISGFFSQLKDGDTFSIIKGSSEWTDGLQRKKDLLAGNYVFKKNLSEGIYIAEAQFDFDGALYQKCLKGKFFIRPIQFEKAAKLNAKRQITKITNFLSNPTFSSVGITGGSIIELENTQFNDGIYTVIKMTMGDDDMESITVSPPIKQNEDRLGHRTTVKTVTRSNVTLTGTIGSKNNRDSGSPPDTPGRGRGIAGSGSRAITAPATQQRVTETERQVEQVERSLPSTPSTPSTPSVPSTPSTPSTPSAPSAPAAPPSMPSTPSYGGGY
jgi:hypothetical protein